MESIVPIEMATFNGNLAGDSFERAMRAVGQCGVGHTVQTVSRESERRFRDCRKRRRSGKRNRGRTSISVGETNRRQKRYAARGLTGEERGEERKMPARLSIKVLQAQL